ncbi:MAG: GAF domain-containing protein, partial [Bacteroidota bacterium]
MKRSEPFMSYSPLEEAMKKGDRKRKLRLALLRYKSVDEVLSEGLKICRQELSAQSVSVFLFNKVGLLERKSICSIDSSGRELDANVWDKEVYRPGQGFLRDVVPALEGTPYGSPKIVNALAINHEVSQEKIRLYSKILGKVESIIFFPLDGRNRTYGIIEVINKVRPLSEDSSDNSESMDFVSFQERDIDFLADFSTYVSTAISNSKHVGQIKLLAKLGQNLVKARVTDGLSKTLNLALQNLVSSKTSFEACILRVAVQTGRL